MGTHAGRACKLHMALACRRAEDSTSSSPVPESDDALRHGRLALLGTAAVTALPSSKATECKWTSHGSELGRQPAQLLLVPQQLKSPASG